MKRAVVMAIVLSSGLLIGGNINDTVFAENIKPNNAVQQVKSLAKEEALEILSKYNNKLNYLYQGDENIFNVLKEKGLKGYVFLPGNIDTDLGYFVDKNTKEIYYFHPSGYMDLIK